MCHTCITLGDTAVVLVVMLAVATGADHLVLPKIWHHINKAKHGLRSHSLQFSHLMSLMQVAYPGQLVSLPVNVTAGLISIPAAVDYSVTMLTPVDQPILPLLNGSLDGTLAWDPAQRGGAAIALPINWTAVRSSCKFCCEGGLSCCMSTPDRRGFILSLTMRIDAAHMGC